MLPFVDQQKLKGKRKKEALLETNIASISNDIERPIQEYRCYLVPGDTMVELTASRDQTFEGQARWAWNTLKPVYDVKADKINKWIEVRLSYRSEMIQQDFRFIIEMMRKMQDREFYAYSIVLERLQWLINQYRMEQDWRENEEKRTIMKSLLSKSKTGQIVTEKGQNIQWEIENELRKAEIKRKAQLRAALEAKELEFDLFAKIELPQVISRITRGEQFYSAIVYNCAQGLLQKKIYSLVFSDESTEVLQGSQKRFLNSIMRRGWGDSTAAAERRASTLYQIMQFSDVLQQQLTTKEQPSVNKLQAGLAVQMLLQGHNNSNNNGNMSETEGIKMIMQQIGQQGKQLRNCSQNNSAVSSQQNIQTQELISQTLAQSMQQLSQFQSQRDLSCFQVEQYEQLSQNSSSGQQILFQQLQQLQQQQQNIQLTSSKSSFSLTTNETIKDKQKDNISTKELSQQQIIQQVLPFKLLGMSQARVEINEGIRGGNDMEMRLFDGYSIFGKMRDVTVYKYSGNEVIGMATIYMFEMPEGATEALKKSREENQMKDGDLEDLGEDIGDMNQFEYNLQVKKFIKKFNIQVQTEEEKENLRKEDNKCDIEED